MRLVRRCRILAAFSLAGVASGAFGQELQQGTPPMAVPPPAVPSSLNSCVLHVWPSSTAKSSYTGWFHGGAVDGDRRGIKGYPALHGDVLSTTVQQQLLKAMDWNTLVERRASAVMVHDVPPEPGDDLGRATSLIAERPDCYEELIVHSVFVERAAFSATTVRVMVIAKKWQDQVAAPKTYSWMANERADFGGGDEQTIEGSLKRAFTSSIQRVLDSSYMHHR